MLSGLLAQIYIIYPFQVSSSHLLHISFSFSSLCFCISSSPFFASLPSSLFPFLLASFFSSFLLLMRIPKGLSFKFSFSNENQLLVYSKSYCLPFLKSTNFSVSNFFLQFALLNVCFVLKLLSFLNQVLSLF